MKSKNRLFYILILSLVMFLVGFAGRFAAWQRIANADSQNSRSNSGEKGSPTSIADARSSTRDSGRIKNESVQSMHLISDGAGWVIAQGHLLWTTSSGRDWKDISPYLPMGNVLEAFFKDTSTGWTVLKAQDAGAKQGFLLLASTTNGGRTWSFTQLLSTTEYSRYEFGNEVSLQFVDPSHGWVMLKLASSSNFSKGLLLESSDGGNSWQKLPEPPIGDSLRFNTDKDGWLAGGAGGDKLYVTRDGGLTWNPVSLEPPPADYRLWPVAFDLPTFQNAEEGILPVTFAGPESSVVGFYGTNDNGKTWKLKQATPISDAISVGNKIASAVIASDSFVVASPGKLSLTVIENGQTRLENVLVKGLRMDARIIRTDFESSRVGWLLVNEGACDGFKSDCRQAMRLFATNDGGRTLIEITPHITTSQLESKDTTTSDLSSTPEVILTTGVSHNQKGFDKCAADTVGNMQTWWNSSPYFDANIYIGGVNRGCSQSNLSSSWVSQVFAQGWGLIPTWVGPQAPCTTCTTCSVMSSNASTAQSQGISEANSAADAAASLGLTQTIIYYDMERYNPDTTCQNAVRAFINGWVQQMHARGNLAGVYGSPQNAQDDWSTISNAPDAVWIAKWDGNVSVFGLTPLSDSFWINSQRIHQYQGGHNETYAGITFNIDNDYEDAPVARPSSTNLPNLTPYQPSGWSDRIVVSNLTGTSTDSSPLTTTDTLYVDWAVINNGNAATGATFYTNLFVDGVQRNSWFTNPPLNSTFYAYVQDYSIGSLSAGTHTIKIVTDATSAISESNEADNEYTKTINVVTVGQPNLTPYQPGGWSDKIVVSNITGTSTDSNPLRTTDTLYVDWAVINNGTGDILSTFNEKLYVDGAERATFTTNPPLNSNFYTYIQDYSIGSLSAGTHTIKIVADSGNVISESNESDNEYTKSITVTGTGTGNWTQLTSTPPAALTNCLLLTDARVMCQRYGTNQWYALTPNSSGSYVNGTWSALASMQSGYNPVYFASAVLPDGRVIIEGGEYNCNSSGTNCTADWQTQGAIYDPVVNSWTPVSPPSGWTSIGDAAGVVLADGTFFLSDALSRKTAKFNATTLTWTPFGTGFQAPTNDETGWTLLPDNSLLTVDATPANSLLSERFNPTTGVWAGAGNTPVSLADNDSARGANASYEIGPGVLRPNGTVLFVGANPNIGTTCCAGSAHTAIFNTATNAWTAGPNIPNSDAANDAPAAVLPNGNVLMQLAPPASPTNVFGTPSRFYEFDGSTIFQVNSPASTNYASYLGGMLLLPTGQVLFTHQSTDVEVYTSSGLPNSAWAPAITSVSSTLQPGGTYTLTGAQLNGLTQGAYYGDDLQAATNYPVVRITNNATGHIFYARTHGHSSMGVATGSATVSTSFDVPAGIELGASTLSVVANGIASSAVSVNINTSGVQVFVQTSPSGRTFTVDGVTYSTAQSFTWTSGSSHTIGTTSPQSGGTGTQYVWSSWSDGGAILHNVAPTSNTTYTANFTTQYLLTMSAGAGGTVSPPSGFFNSGQSVQISAAANGGFNFNGWTGSGAGSYTGTNNPATVTMNGPITETASFVTSPTMIQVIVQTSPSGRSFAVDGVNYTSMQTLSWAAGTSHTISTTSPQSGGVGTQFVWNNWSDGGSISHSIAPTTNTSYTASFSSVPGGRTSFDYDGDGKADVSVFRPTSGTWYFSNSSNGAFTYVQFGANGDLIAPADFDGDGKPDVSVFRPSNGTWYRLNSSNNQFVFTQFGQTGDIPVPGDFDGDGKADISIFRPSNGTWYRLNSSDGQFIFVQFGANGDKPQVGDFDGDGKTDLVVFRPSTGVWYTLRSTDGAFIWTVFGQPGDIATPADYDNDGKTDISVFRPSNGTWYRLNSSDGQFVFVQFGANGDIPAAADFDGDGKADPAVFRPSNGYWYLLRSTQGFIFQQFGASGDIPTPAAFGQ